MAVPHRRSEISNTSGDIFGQQIAECAGFMFEQLRSSFAAMCRTAPTGSVNEGCCRSACCDGRTQGLGDADTVQSQPHMSMPVHKLVDREAA